MNSLISAKKAYVFRIVHLENMNWILKYGLFCRNSEHCDVNYVEIGNPDLIEHRRERPVPHPPGGTLSDYIPFYFTPHTPMLYNIKTGYRGVPQRDMAEIVILVSSFEKLKENGATFLFTDRHAFLEAARFSSDVSNLDDWIPWDFLRARDFKRDLDNPEKFERYQAETLIHRNLPVTALVGLLCYSEAAQERLHDLANLHGVSISTAV